MPIEITVPRLGWSAEEGTFAGWLKAPGERVVSGEPLFALESDKVTMEVESLDNGVLQVLPDGPEAGATVLVGQLLGYLVVEGRATAPALPSPRRQLASPRARAAAKRLDLDIATVPAKPGAKRVVEADVLRAAQAVGMPPPRQEPRPTGRRKAIAARLEESFRAPHFYLQAEINATALASFRDQLAVITEERHGIRPTYNDLLVKAAALALAAVPEANAFWRDGEAVPWPSIDISLAVQAGQSLLVPVIRHADRLSIADIARERERLVTRCRNGHAQPSDWEGGSLTVSNLGAFGVDRFQAILNPPQCAILAVGRLMKRPVVEGDAVVARLTLPLTLSVDHRVLDGVAAARLLGAMVSLLESPLRLAF